MIVIFIDRGTNMDREQGYSVDTIESGSYEVLYEDLNEDLNED